MEKTKKFNLTQLLNQRSIEQSIEENGEKNQPGPEGAKHEEMVMADVYNLEPSKENFYRVDDSLKRSIELVGVLQPLLVSRLGNGKYKVIAGHRRRLAVLALVKEGKEERRYVPCVFKKEDVRDRLAIIMANRFRDKTDWERMMEAAEADGLARELKKEYKLEGRTREVLAEITGMSEAQLGRYKAIFNNLDKGLMGEFKEGRIGLSVVSELCGLPNEWQKKAGELLRERGLLSLADIKELKQRKEEEKQVQEPIETPINRTDKQDEKKAREGRGKEKAKDRQAGVDRIQDRKERKDINREPEGEPKERKESRDQKDRKRADDSHDISEQIIEVFEKFLERHHIRIPSPEKEPGELDDHGRLYGSVYLELLNEVEEIIKEIEVKETGDHES